MDFGDYLAGADSQSDKRQGVRALQAILPCPRNREALAIGSAQDDLAPGWGAVVGTPLDQCPNKRIYANRMDIAHALDKPRIQIRWPHPNPV